MREKMVVFLICVLLVFSTASLALTPFDSNEQQMKNSYFNTTPVPIYLSKGWMKTFGGTGSDCGYSVQQTTDGGYIIAGETSSFGAGNYDVCLIKTDGNGNKMWDKTFGGTSEDRGYSVKQTTEGGYIITGEKWSFGAGWYDFWLIKTDANGNEVWNRTLGGTERDCGYSVQQTSDGGYIITGYTESFTGFYDVWLIKSDGNGNIMWDKIFGGESGDFGMSAQQIIDGGYIIIGYTYSFGVGDGNVWLIKTDSNGNEVWNRTLGGKGANRGYCGQQTTDGGYIITGYAGVQGFGIADVRLIKTDYDGNEVWNKTFGRPYDDLGMSVRQTTDGGYIITGTGSGDVWLIKTDDNGNKMWDKTFGGRRSDCGYSVQQTTDGGYIIAGETHSFGGGVEVLLIKTNSQGKSKYISLGSLLFEKLVQRFPFFEKILNLYL